MNWRIYFNAWQEAPLLWSVDQGTQETEIKVEGVRIDGAIYLDTYTDMTIRRNQKIPCAWIRVFGVMMTVENRIAVFRRE